MIQNDSRSIVKVISIFINLFRMAADTIALFPLRLLRGLGDFFHFWYIRNSADYWRRKIAFLRSVERDIGIVVNLKMITQPIYGDYTFAGRIIGPIFRLGRVLFGCLLFFISLIAVVVIYMLYLLMPVIVAVMLVENLVYVLLG